jgi:hypothetical protein
VVSSRQSHYQLSFHSDSVLSPANRLAIAFAGRAVRRGCKRFKIIVGSFCVERVHTFNKKINLENREMNAIRTVIGQMAIVVCVLSFATSITAGSLADHKIKAACHVLEDEMRDCGCVVSFLQQHIGADRGLLLLRTWAAGSGRLGDHLKAFAALYREHPEASVLDASMSFLKVRTEFLMQCRPSTNFFEEPELIESPAEPAS